MSSNLKYKDYFKKITENKNTFLITGAPGTGKTHFLIEFIVYLIETLKLDYERILVFTFDRKTSKFLRDSIARMAKKTISEIPILTFYSFCLEVLNEYTLNSKIKDLFSKNQRASDVEKKNSQIECFFNCDIGGLKLLTAPEQWNVISNILSNINEKKHPKIYRLLLNNNTKENITQEIFDYILRAQENLLSPKQLALKFTPFINKLMHEVNDIYRIYEEKLKKENYLDYGSLLFNTYLLLKENENIRNYHINNYDFILIDEFQETNLAQFEILKLISNKNVVFFGDDDQLIYKFRGSNINNFYKIYDSLPSENKIILNKDYRNSFEISFLLESFISKNSKRIAKDYLVEDNPISSECEIMIKSFDTLYDELNFIKNKIKFLNKVKKIKLDNIAVIVKGTELETVIIENFFIQNNVDYYRRNPRAIINNKFINYTLNLLRLVSLIKDNKSNNTVSNSNEIPISSKVNQINLIGGKNTSNFSINLLLKSILLSEFINFDSIFYKDIEFNYHNYVKNVLDINLWSYLRKNLKAIKNQDENSFKKIIKLNKATQKLMDLGEKDVFDVVFEIISNKVFGICNLFNKFKNLNQSEKNSIKVFIDFIISVKNFSAEHKNESSLDDYLKYFEKFLRNQFIEEVEDTVKYAKEEGVRILSFYDCKNSEFDAVLIPFLNKGYYPSVISRPQVYELEVLHYLIDGKIPDEEGLRNLHLEQERNILYTGISRAKKFLYVTCSKNKEQSIFFKEIENIVKEENKGKKILKNGSIFNRTQQPDSYHYFIDQNPELIKKKAIVSVFRCLHEMDYSKERYDYFIYFLKNNYNPIKWWDLISETRNNNNPFKNNYKAYSYSSIESYDDCPLKYKIKYFFGLKSKEENLSLLVGSIYHSIIGRFLNESQNYDENNLFEIFEQEIEQNRTDLKYNFYFNEVKDQIQKDLHCFYIDFKKYFGDNLSSKRENKLFFTEKNFDFLIDDSIKITGKIDLINIVDKNLIEIIDFKSSSRRLSEEELKNDLQLRIYNFALKNSVNLKKEIPTALKSDVLLKYYLLQEEKEPFLEVSFSEEDENMVLDKIKNIVKEIESENFYLKPRDYNSCKYCEFKIFCEKYYGEPI
jgi:DNA helicase-2/ATP-dependent DNA helicase PcrA